MERVREIAKIERQHFLILDDFGIALFGTQSRSALMEIIEDRHGKGSLIITSQVLVMKWHEVIGEKTEPMQYLTESSMSLIDLSLRENHSEKNVHNQTK